MRHYWSSKQANFWDFQSNNATTRASPATNKQTALCIACCTAMQWPHAILHIFSKKMQQHCRSTPTSLRRAEAIFGRLTRQNKAAQWAINVRNFKWSSWRQNLTIINPPGPRQFLGAGPKRTWFNTDLMIGPWTQKCGSIWVNIYCYSMHSCQYKYKCNPDETHRSENFGCNCSQCGVSQHNRPPLRSCSTSTAAA